jgi:hypothetical protein
VLSGRRGSLLLELFDGARDGGAGVSVGERLLNGLKSCQGASAT